MGDRQLRPGDPKEENGMHQRDDGPLAVGDDGKAFHESALFCRTNAQLAMTEITGTVESAIPKSVGTADLTCSDRPLRSTLKPPLTQRESEDSAMNVDLYTKSILTAIAACLLWLCWRGGITTVHAQDKFNPSYV